MISLAEIYNGLENISAFSAVVPLACCLYRFKALNFALWIVFFYLIACLAFDRLSLLFINDKSFVNLLLNLFTILEGGMICAIYYLEFDNFKGRVFALLSMSLILFSALIVFIVFGNLFRNDITVNSIEASLITLLAGYYIVYNLKDDNTGTVSTSYFSWINLSFLLYFSSALVIFASGDYLQKSSRNTNFIIWGVHLCLNSVTNVLIAIGVWKRKQQQH